jgi:hypothetical protein
MKATGIEGPGTSKWVSVPLPSAQPDLTGGLDSLRQMTDVIEVGDNTIDGVICHHSRGTISEQAFAAATSGLATTNPAADGQLEVEFVVTRMTVDVWIGVDDGFVRQQRVEQVAQIPDVTGTPGATTTSSLTTKYSSIGEPVNIEAPTDTVPLESTP